MVFIMFILYVSFSLLGPKQPQPSASPIKLRSMPPVRILDQSSPPSPIPSTTAIPSISSELTKNDIINFLPVVTDIYNIEYLSYDDHFLITVKQGNYQQVQEQAKQWFRNLNFNPDTLNIYWVADPYVQQ